MSTTEKIDFYVIGDPGDTVFLVAPAHPIASEYLKENVEGTFFGSAVGVEHRYLEGLIEHLIEAGFSVDKED